MGNRRPVHTDVMPIAKVQELLAYELCAVVSADDIGHPKSVDFVGEEHDGLLRADVGNGSSLDPWRTCQWLPAGACTLLSSFGVVPRGRGPRLRMTK